MATIRPRRRSDKSRVKPEQGETTPARRIAGHRHWGEVRDLTKRNEQRLSPTERLQAEHDLDVRVRQAAAAAKRMGEFGTTLREMVEIANDRVDWRDKFRMTFDGILRGEVSWARPNRRFIQQGKYMPGWRRTGAGRIGFVLDTSGSISSGNELSVYTAAVLGHLRAHRASIAVDQHGEDHLPQIGPMVLAVTMLEAFIGIMADAGVHMIYLRPLVPPAVPALGQHATIYRPWIDQESKHSALNSSPRSAASCSMISSFLEAGATDQADYETKQRALLRNFGLDPDALPPVVPITELKELAKEIQIKRPSVEQQPQNERPICHRLTPRS